MTHLKAAGMGIGSRVTTTAKMLRPQNASIKCGTIGSSGSAIIATGPESHRNNITNSFNRNMFAGVCAQYVCKGVTQICNKRITTRLSSRILG